MYQNGIGSIILYAKRPQLLKLKNSETYFLMMMAVSAAVMIATVVLTAVVFVLTVL